MKKIFLITLLTGGMVACSGTSEKQTEETTPEQEAEMVETINADLDQSQKELANETDKSLNEIDSLLQNVE